MNLMLQCLLQQHNNKTHLPLELVARCYFGLSKVTFKKKLKQGELSKILSDSIIEEHISISALAETFYSLRGDALSTNDNDLHAIIMVKSLVEYFGGALVPYKDVAEKLLNWNEGTAKARLKSGEVKKLGLSTIKTHQSPQSPVFVYVGDIMNFFLMRREVNIYERNVFS